MISLLSLWLAGVASPETPVDSALIPDSRFAAGWSVSGSTEQYDTASLYQYLDGGADVVLEFGLNYLTFRRYIRREQEIDLELYHMSSPEAALGLYFSKAGKGPLSTEIPARNSVASSQILTVKGSYVGVITLLQSDSTTLHDATALAQKLVSRLPSSGDAPLLDFFPRTELISGSVRVVHGPLSTPSAFTPVRGLIVRLCESEFGIAGDYQTGPGIVEHRLIIPFADSSAARSALEGLQHPSDSISLVRLSSNKFTLQGTQGALVKVILSGKTLEIVVR